jgi:dTDP-4-amino-4,6-dideoxygalactose transaminase
MLNSAKSRSRVLPILNLKAQYESLRGDIVAAVLQVLENQHFILGPNVLALEHEIADLCRCPFAVGVGSGTDALILALRAAGVGAGDEVIVPSFSFIATADAVSILNAIPVFADIDPCTFNIDVAHAATLITARTSAIIPVHLFGQPADMDAIAALAGRHNLTVIEDCAQALGASWNGNPTCSFGHYGCISFFPSKNLGACGDGGMVTVRTAEQADRLAMLRSHGGRKKYHSDIQGMNSRLDELQAAILRVKLPHLKERNQARRQVAAMYREVLGGLQHIILPFECANADHVYHQFTVRLANRDEVQKSLGELGVQTMIYYPVPLHLQKMYLYLGYRPGDLPAAEQAAAEVLSLPMFPEMTAGDVEYVAECLEACVSAPIA